MSSYGYRYGEPWIRDQHTLDRIYKIYRSDKGSESGRSVTSSGREGNSTSSSAGDESVASAGRRHREKKRDRERSVDEALSNALEVVRIGGNVDREGGVSHKTPSQPSARTSSSAAGSRASATKRPRGILVTRHEDVNRLDREVNSSVRSGKSRTVITVTSRVRASGSSSSSSRRSQSPPLQEYNRGWDERETVCGRYGTFDNRRSADNYPSMPRQPVMYQDPHHARNPYAPSTYRRWSTYYGSSMPAGYSSDYGYGYDYDDGYGYGGGSMPWVPGYSASGNYYPRASGYATSGYFQSNFDAIPESYDWYSGRGSMPREEGSSDGSCSEFDESDPDQSGHYA